MTLGPVTALGKEVPAVTHNRHVVNVGGGSSGGNAENRDLIYLLGSVNSQYQCSVPWAPKGALEEQGWEN